MSERYLLLPGGEEGQKDGALVSQAAPAFAALWDPALLSQADSVPSIRPIDNLPKPNNDTVVAYLRSSLERVGDLARRDLADWSGRTLIVENQLQSEDEILDWLAPLGLPTGDPILRRDFWVLGASYWGLERTIEAMGRDNPIDDFSLFTEARRAADAWLRGDEYETRAALQASFDLLLNARHIVYPAPLSVVDLVFFHPAMTLEHITRRSERRSPWNLIINARELETLEREKPDAVSMIRQLAAAGEMEVLGGTFDQEPMGLLPVESQQWRLTHAAKIYERALGRRVDGFASRTSALVPDLPRLLMKFQFRHGLHASFDGAAFPRFRETKLHWTSADGSVLETLARLPRDAGDAREFYGVYHAIGRSFQVDRAATLSLAHWMGHETLWYRWLLRATEYVELFGKFETLGNYFISAYTAEGPTHPSADEYLTREFERISANPISRWIDHHALRGRFDALRAVGALGSILGQHPSPPFEEVEARIEERQENSESALNDLERAVVPSTAAAILDGSPTSAGWLVINPSPFARRGCLFLDGPVDNDGLIAIKAIQPTMDKTAVVVDVPGWGFSWIRRGAALADKPTRPSNPLAVGRRLRNDHLELEVDAKTGGLRGIWDLKTGYRRLAQQLVWCDGDPRGVVGRAVAESVKITSAGPAYGEIEAVGSLMDLHGKKRVARFRQRTRLWLGRSLLELSWSLSDVAPLGGKRSEQYLGCRWAWPDEKTIVAPARGTLLESSHAEEIEAPELIELRERTVITDLLTKGLPFHRRVGPRLLDTRLLVAEETRREFSMAVALDLGRPFAAAEDQSRPLVIEEVSSGPPTPGPTSWLGRISSGQAQVMSLSRTSHEPPRITLRMAESAGKSAHLDLSLCRPLTGGRLVNGFGELIFELHTSPTSVPIDFSPYEWLQLEVDF